MILVRVPLRISFLGGGSDLPDVYRRVGGRVLSTTIDKYVYLAINRPAFFDTVSVRYSETETVPHAKNLRHPLFRVALLDLGIERGIEVGSFASVPTQTGLGSSSSFAVALAKGLSSFNGDKISKEEAARRACRFEIELLKNPIGKQDQYAASYGGFNTIEFLPDDRVIVQPVLMDFRKRKDLNNHLMLFFTGLTRDANAVLGKQRERIAYHLDRYKRMAQKVSDLEQMLLEGDIERVGLLLHEGWLEKRELGSDISNRTIDTLYEAGRSAGAWGGKVLGAGGGGCILFVAPPVKHDDIRKNLLKTARANSMNGFREIPFSFTEGGAEILANHLYQ